MNNDIQELKDKIQAIENNLYNAKVALAAHFHDGNFSTRVNLADIIGLLDTTSSTPTVSPGGVWDQVKVASTGLYVYYPTTNTWIFVASASGVTGQFYAASTSGGSPTHLVSVTNGIITSIA